MLYWKDNKFNAERFKASVTVKMQEKVLLNEEYREKKTEEVPHTMISYIHDKEWHEEIQQRVFGINKDEIIYKDFSLSEEQLERLEEMISEVIDYVIENKFQEGTRHGLREFQLEKENKFLREELSSFYFNKKEK